MRRRNRRSSSPSSTRRGTHGPAQRIGDERRGRPQSQDRDGRGERARAHQRDQEEAAQRDQRARDHLHQEQPRARPPRLAGPAGFAGRGRLPLQQAAPGRRETDEGQHDRVGPLVSLAGQERELQRDLSEHGLPVLPRGAEEHPPRLLRPGTRGGLQEQRIKGKGQGGQDGGRPDRRASRQDRPGQKERGDGRGGHEAAPQVVEDLPARDEGQPVALRPERVGTQGNSQRRICQSPRTQRCWRRAWARTLAG